MSKILVALNHTVIVAGGIMYHHNDSIQLRTFRHRPLASQWLMARIRIHCIVMISCHGFYQFLAVVKYAMVVTIWAEHNNDWNLCIHSTVKPGWMFRRDENLSVCINRVVGHFLFLEMPLMFTYFVCCWPRIVANNHKLWFIPYHRIVVVHQGWSHHILYICCIGWWFCIFGGNKITFQHNWFI